MAHFKHSRGSYNAIYEEQRREQKKSASSNETKNERTLKCNVYDIHCEMAEETIDLGKEEVEK